MGKTIEQVLSTYQVLYLILAQAIAHQNGLHNPKERKKYHAPENWLTLPPPLKNMMVRPLQ